MNLQTMLNYIRQNASEEYQTLIPEATRENLQEIGYAVLSDVNLQNEFTSALVTKVAFTYVHDKIFNNPLKMLKKGNKPLADTIEEVFVNFAKGEEFDPEGLDLLARKLPDIKSVYHKMNRKGKYKVTISTEMLKTAFRSYGDLQNLYNRIVNSLFNGDEYE